MKSTLFTIALLSVLGLSAQTSVSFLHLGDATFQNNYLNPSLIPRGKTYFGLPVLSGVHINFNNKTSYNESFTKESGKTIIDIDKILPNLQNQNFTSFHANVNLLHFGTRLKNGALISFMANERVEIDALYSNDLVNFVWKGNDQFAGQEVKVSDAGVIGVHFREIGLGYSAPVNERMNLGVRGKLLVGFANFSTPNNFKSKLTSSGEAFQLDAEWKNFALRTSGRDIYSGDEGNLGSHLAFNSNLGAAIDIGVTYHLNRYYTVSASLLDVGFISWKENIQSETLRDTTFNYSGVELEDLGSIRQVLEDSLVNKFKPDDNFDPYTSWLPIKAYGSWIYHYGKNTDIYVSGGARYVQRQLKMLYGVGVTQKFGNNFTGSISATKLPQQFLNMGVAFTVHGGPVQFYMAADQIINFSVPDSKAIDFRLGMNFILGRNDDSGGSGGSKERINKRAKGMDTNVFLGRGVKTKKREGIYSIIKRQKKRDIKNKRSKRDKKVENESLNGRKGRKNSEQDLK